jgi:adenine phosphoribosyltransferase
MSVERLRAAIRDVPDFPKPGIVFKDITPVLGSPELFKAALGILSRCHIGKRVDKIAAIDARGFLFGGAMADRLGVGIVPIRKKGKLPYKTFEETYDLEYGSATLTIHQDAFRNGDRVVLVDDLLATGGTAAASAMLIEKAGGKVVEIDFLVELAFLKGRAKLAAYPVFAPLVF